MKKVKRAIRNVAHRHRPTVMNRGTILRRIAKKFNLIYFGKVDQNKDEHDLIRGITVSPVHNDDHYMVGTYEGRNVSIVDRSDVLGHGKQETRYYWLTIRVELDYILSHILLFPLSHENRSYKQLTAHHHIIPVNSLLDSVYNDEFLRRYDVYSFAGHAHMVENIIPPDVAQVIAARFWPSAIEVDGKYLYVYLDEKALNETKTAAMVDAAVWLADRLSESS